MKTPLFNKILGKFGFQILRDGAKLEAVNLGKIKKLRLVFSYFCYLLLVWGLYRLLIRLPENIEELILKPLIWLGGLYWVVKRVEKKPLVSLGWSLENLFPSLYLGIGLGLVFAFEAILVNIVKYGSLSLPEANYTGWGFGVAFLVSLVTSFSEELAFRGFIFSRLLVVWKKEWQANLVSSILFVLIHLPVTIFVLRYDFLQLLGYSLLVFVYSLGAGFVFGRTKSIIAPILLHVFWAWPIILFR